MIDISYILQVYVSRIMRKCDLCTCEKRKRRRLACASKETDKCLYVRSIDNRHLRHASLFQSLFLASVNKQADVLPYLVVIPERRLSRVRAHLSVVYSCSTTNTINLTVQVPTMTMRHSLLHYLSQEIVPPNQECLSIHVGMS